MALVSLILKRSGLDLFDMKKASVITPTLSCGYIRIQRVEYGVILCKDCITSRMWMRLVLNSCNFLLLQMNIKALVRWPAMHREEYFLGTRNSGFLNMIMPTDISFNWMMERNWRYPISISFIRISLMNNTCGFVHHEACADGTKKLVIQPIIIQLPCAHPWPPIRSVASPRMLPEIFTLSTQEKFAVYPMGKSFWTPCRIQFKSKGV